jgi:hypothetical protein
VLAARDGHQVAVPLRVGGLRREHGRADAVHREAECRRGALLGEDLGDGHEADHAPAAPAHRRGRLEPGEARVGERAHGRLGPAGVAVLVGGRPRRHGRRDLAGRVDERPQGGRERLHAAKASRRAEGSGWSRVDDDRRRGPRGRSPRRPPSAPSAPSTPHKPSAGPRCRRSDLTFRRRLMAERIDRRQFAAALMAPVVGGALGGAFPRARPSRGASRPPARRPRPPSARRRGVPRRASPSSWRSPASPASACAWCRTGASPGSTTTAWRTRGRAAVSAETLWVAASLSKPVFALAALRLADEGRLELDRPLRGYVPDHAAADARGDRITARHVLGHSSGLPNWRERDDQPLALTSSRGRASGTRARGTTTCSGSSSAWPARGSSS